MSVKSEAARFIHLQHKKDLLKGEKSYLTDKLAFVRASLKDVTEQLRKIKTG